MKILITAGPTREYFDPVRFISNASSGQMGLELARAALEKKHAVTLITSLDSNQIPQLPRQVKIIKAVSCDQMLNAVKKHLPENDCLIMAAAVSDYKPADQAKIKIKKSDKPLTIELAPTTDILKWAASNRTTPKQTIVGFALEDTDILNRAEKKLKNKNLDIIIANSPDAIGSPQSQLSIKTKNSTWQKLGKIKKSDSAKHIIEMIEKYHPKN
jgi:phosphopantothenoylcysteine decarboxylase/phosphopantothenate--cysteine ligase